MGDVLILTGHAAPLERSGTAHQENEHAVDECPGSGTPALLEGAYDPTPPPPARARSVTRRRVSAEVRTG